VEAVYLDMLALWVMPMHFVRFLKQFLSWVRNVPQIAVVQAVLARLVDALMLLSLAQEVVVVTVCALLLI
jgi:hypothetical protein